MDHITRLLKDVKRLERETMEYMRVCVIKAVKTANKYTVEGLNRYFDSMGAAVEYCKDQARGRSVSIIIDDIPQEPAQIQTRVAVFETSYSEEEQENEKNEPKDENPDRGSTDSTENL